MFSFKCSHLDVDLMIYLKGKVKLFVFSPPVCTDGTGSFTGPDFNRRLWFPDREDEQLEFSNIWSCRKNGREIRKDS